MIRAACTHDERASGSAAGGLPTRAAAIDAAIAAVIAATSSGVASGEIDRSSNRPAAQSGTFPCLRWGSFSFFDRSISSDSTSTLRVSRGSMTSST